MALTAEHMKGEGAGEAEDLLETAFRENWSRVVAILYRLVGENGEAEDLALETFWRLHRSPPRWTGADGLRGWLYRVATNLGLNALRARGRRRRYEEQAGSMSYREGPADAEGDPAQAVERQQERQRVRQALAQMRPRSAQLLLLRHSGFRYGEIAAALGVAPTSVGALLARAEAEFEKHYRGLS